MQISHPLVYSVRISSKASTTAEDVNFYVTVWELFIVVTRISKLGSFGSFVVICFFSHVFEIFFNEERKKQGSLICRAGELYNRGIGCEAFPAMPRFQYYDPQIVCPGFVFRLRVVLTFLVIRNFKVKKLFVGVIFSRKLTMPHSHGIREEC